MDPQVDRVVAEARARSIDVRTKIGQTFYCETWALGDALVVRIPRTEFPPDLARGDGPFMPDGPVDPRLFSTLLESSTDRLRGIESGPLARFVDRLELAGVPVALHERAVGRPPIAGDLPAIARALAALHDVLGYHGHLVPAHIVVDGDHVTFTDPLPAYPRLLGGLGYALPIATQDLAPHDEGMLLRDVVALAAIAAEADGVTELGWSLAFVGFLERINRGGASRPWDALPALAELHNRMRHVANAWPDAAGRLALDHYLPTPSVRPKSISPRAAIPGTARSLLERYELHAALGLIARRLTASPSLFDFLWHERAAAIASTESRPDPTLAFEARNVSFAAIAAALPELERLYAEAAPVAVAPVVHHRDVFPETHGLRTLLVDLDRLLAPTPPTLVEAGGLVARVRTCVDELRDPQRLAIAARRYVNYVSNTHRVY